MGRKNKYANKDNEMCLTSKYKTENMTFKELYTIELRKPTAAALFVKNIAEATHRQENTVRMWLAGRQKPDELACSIIAKELGVNPDELFPEES